ncbi:hypothetical protein CCAX7_13480 [Capsulimonas corticalis]|uniref:Uncharacterized protein n=1 Tax=Capsulimonas corticalis TaxID=2219043 RepID=A0A402D4Q8_9BACT|nr:hypothetical protein CCAX7_13480 [Capsulimonas corticalis]
MIDQRPSDGVTKHCDLVGFSGQWGGYTDWEINASSGGSIPNPVLMTHRYYDSRTGRFINPGPIRRYGSLYLWMFPVARRLGMRNVLSFCCGE